RRLRDGGRQPPAREPFGRSHLAGLRARQARADRPDGLQVQEAHRLLIDAAAALPPAGPKGAPPALPFFVVRKIQTPCCAMVRPPDAYAWQFRTAPDAYQPRGMTMDRKAWRQVAASMML